jgi:hypothetical protein
VFILPRLDQSEGRVFKMAAVNVNDINIGMTEGQASNSPINEGAIREFLSAKHHWPEGLQTQLVSSLKKIPLRFFICDDSGSMMTSDGHRVENGRFANTEHCINFVYS